MLHCPRDIRARTRISHFIASTLLINACALSQSSCCRPESATKIIPRLGTLTRSAHTATYPPAEIPPETMVNECLDRPLSQSPSVAFPSVLHPPCICANP